MPIGKPKTVNQVYDRITRASDLMNEIKSELRGMDRSSVLDAEMKRTLSKINRGLNEADDNLDWLSGDVEELFGEDDED
jgi:DNA-binding transcriptional regulator GbsR (MarR family)